MDKEYLNKIIELIPSTIEAYEKKRERVLERLAEVENEE